VAKPKDEPKRERGPVNYLAFVEGEGGFWWLAAADAEATSVYTLRKEIIRQLESEGSLPDKLRIVIVPTGQAHVVEHTREIIQKDSFSATKLRADDAGVSAPPPLPPAGTEAGIAARSAALTPPDGAIVGIGEAAAAAAAAAEAAGRAASVMPVDPDDDEAEYRNPDVDPITGISRRPASQATPADEGRTVFPIEGDE